MTIQYSIFLIITINFAVNAMIKNDGDHYASGISNICSHNDSM